MDVFQASKAAMIRFYETLRSELGSEIRITITTPGYVASEITQGKVLKKDGEVGIDKEARDVCCQSLTYNLLVILQHNHALKMCHLCRELNWCVINWQVQLGPVPVGSTKKCAEIIVDGACKGDEYVTWPSWFKPFYMVMSLAPEVVNWFSHSFHVAKPGETETLSKRILEATGAKKFFYPASIQSPTIMI